MIRGEDVLKKAYIGIGIVLLSVSIYIFIQMQAVNKIEPNFSFNINETIIIC